MKMRKTILLLFILCSFLIFTSFVAHAKVGMIVKVLSQQEMTVNIGKQDGAQTGDNLTVFRIGKAIAIGKIQKIDDTSCVIRILENKTSDMPDIGDSVAKDASALTENNNSVSNNPSSVQTYVAQTPGANVPVTQPFTQNNNPTNGTQPQMNNTSTGQNVSNKSQEGYLALLRDRTRSETVSVDGTDGDVTCDNSNITDSLLGGYLLWNTISFGDPLNIAAMAFQQVTMPRAPDIDPYNNNGGTNVTPAPVKVTQSRLSAVLWDEKLCDAYATYASFEKCGSNEQAPNFKRQLMEQRCINTNTVFQLSIDNTAPYPLNMSSFKWKVYLVDGQGNRYAVTRYDSVFESQIKPNSRVEGFVYFPKVATAGKLELHVDDILNGNRVLEWKI